MRCFFTSAIPEIEAVFRLNAADEQHLFKVLRAVTGNTVMLIDGHGTSAQAQVVEGRQLQIISRKTTGKPPFAVDLYFTPMRKQKLDTMLKQCCECAVASLNVLICERSVALPDTRRWEQLLIEGCKQSKNPFLPSISAPRKLTEVMRDFDGGKTPAFYGDPDAPNISEYAVSGNRTAWFVGPEGGFSETEKSLLESCGVKPLNIGPFTMRAETAAICGITLLNNLLIHDGLE